MLCVVHIQSHSIDSSHVSADDIQIPSKSNRLEQLLVVVFGKRRTKHVVFGNRSVAMALNTSVSHSSTVCLCQKAQQSRSWSRLPSANMNIALDSSVI